MTNPEPPPPSDPASVGKMWDANADAWTELAGGGFDVYRDFVNTPAFLAMLPDVAGRTGLDIGCGEGHNTRLIAARGAAMIGLDISTRMATAARLANQRGNVRIPVVAGDGGSLPFSDGTFDFAVAVMSLMDMPNAPAALAEIARVVRRRGFLQLSVLHPCTNTPYRRWVEAGGVRRGLAVGGDFDQRPWTETWSFGGGAAGLRARHRPFVIPRFPMTVADWFNAIAGAGLRVEQVVEPCASPELAVERPDVADTRIVPYFLLVRAGRP